MHNIRPAIAQDLPYIYEITLKTGFAGSDATDLYSDPYLLGHYYAAPYFFYEPEFCFIALDGTQRPSGYIVGTSDTRLFNEWMHKEWLPPLQRHYRKRNTFASETEEQLVQTLLKGPGEGLWQNLGYPAHLHVDLLPHLQGKGLGKGLMEIFIAAVKKSGKEGIHLGVDGRNVRAYGFYERLGFSVLQQQPWGATFGLRFS